MKQDKVKINQRLASAALAVCACLLAPAAAGTVIPGLYDTGVLKDGRLAPPNSVDMHYSLVSSADPALPGPNAYVTNPIATGSWAPNDTTSQWISPNAGTAWQSYPGGDYTYRLQFNLAGLNPDTASISGMWGADDAGFSGSILINGTPATGNPQATFYWLTPFSIKSGFVTGINTLDFVVRNQTVYPSPTGFRIDDISGYAQTVPEPSILWLFGIGVVGLMGVTPGARRRKNPWGQLFCPVRSCPRDP